MANEKSEKPAALELKVKNKGGSEVSIVQVDPATLGGMVKNRLIHSATVMYHANMRAGTHCTKSRGQIAGSTKKLYRQKGTGRARAGSRKAGQRKHGGTIHGPVPRQYGFEMPKKQRRAALNSSVLGKIKDGEVQIVDTFGLADVKTKAMNDTLKSMSLVKKGERTSLLILTDGYDKNTHLSARNIDGVDVIPVQDANAREIASHKIVVFTKAAFDKFNQMATRTYVKQRAKKAEAAATAAAGGAGGPEAPHAGRPK
jgi:large subunit ribosomal protein L4